MKPLALLVCALLLARPAFADPPSKESVEHLLKVAETERSLVIIHKQIDTGMRGALDQALKKMHAENDAKLYTEPFGKKMAKLVSDELGWGAMRELYQKVYTENFTQEEIDGLIAFFESPVGKAFVTKMPIIAQKTGVLMQQKMTPLMQHLNQALQETINEVQKKKKSAPAEAQRQLKKAGTQRV